jgi:hypothetical protein
VANWIAQQQFDFIYWNMMHDAYYFSISTLPAAAKLVITQRLTTAKVPAKILKEFVSAAEFMNNGSSLDGSEMLEKMKELDSRRGQSLATAAPELANLIGYN